MHLNRLKYILLSLVAVFVFSRTVPAQKLPSLPADSRITKGTLSSGVTYYMVSNPSAKGHAHLAVIQRDFPLSSATREQLDPAFLSRMGVAPGPEGYLSDIDGSTVYHFRDVPFYRPEVLDSMLLYVFAQVAATRAQQAVVVSGDIDPTELKKKMDIFSMLVPRMLVKENHKPDYVWEPSPAPWVEAYPGTSPVSEVSVTYAGARIPYDQMNTAQAIVTDLFGAELQVLLRHRLARNLKDEGIPYGNIGFKTLRSMDYGGDERYTVTVSVAREQADAAMRVISSTLAEIDTRGIPAREFSEAKKVLTPSLRGRASSTPSLEDDIRRCTAHFLYGANLAPYSESLRYFTRKNVADSTEARFFNSFAGALLGQLENLTLEFTGAPDSLDKDQALFNYNLAYLYGSVIPSGKNYEWHSADTLSLSTFSPKIKIKGEKKEAVTGGTLMTFSNGMRVVYKQVPGNGVFHYALQLNGGLALIPDLKEGEGGYIRDMLSLYDVAGIKAPVFRDILAAGGVSMETMVDVNSLSIRGDAPSGQLEFLLKTLLALANRRSLNSSEFALYCQKQELAQPSMTDLLYQRLVPGFVYTAHQLPGRLFPETQTKAHKYYEERFARMQDGVLLISGDLQEETVRRLLLRYLGGFRTQKGSVGRKAVPLRPLSGTVTSTLEGHPRGVYVVMDTEYSLTSEHYYTSLAAAYALEQSLVRHLVPYGYTVKVENNHWAQPQERFQLQITCQPASPQGLPAQLESQDVERALSAIRQAIAASAATPPSATDLKAWKARLSYEAKLGLATPSGFVSTLLDRYSANKDIATRYAESIQSISAAQVQEFLRLLAGGGRIEYLVP